MIYRKSLVEQLGRTFLDYEALGAHQAIAGVATLDGLPDINLLKQRISSLPNIYPELAVSPPLKCVTNREKTLDEVLSDEMTEGISYLSSPVRFVLINSSDEFALATFLHHSFVDGLGGIELIKTLTFDRNTRDFEKEIKARLSFEHSERKSYSVMTALQMALKHSRGQPASEVELQNKTRVIRHLSLSLPDMRALKRKVGATLNELFLLGVFSALKFVYPTRSEAKILVPVNLRPKALQRAPGNYLVVAPFQLPLTTPLTSAALEVIKTSWERVGSSRAIEQFRSARTFVSQLPRSVRHSILGGIGRSSTCIATYIPETGGRRTLAGAPIKEQLGIPALLPNQELGFGLITYADKFTLAVVSSGRLAHAGEEILNNFVSGIQIIR